MFSVVRVSCPIMSYTNLIARNPSVPNKNSHKFRKLFGFWGIDNRLCNAKIQEDSYALPGLR